MNETTGSWLATRWLTPLLEARQLRLQVRRGRVIARKGWVHDLTVKPGIMNARVSSDSGMVHDVQVRMEKVEDEVWDTAIARIAEHAALAGDLLGGRVSEALAGVFEESGHDLFPFDLRDSVTFCTCRQDALVCTGAVATLFEFARLIAADPLSLLEFRGRSREQVLADVRGLRHSDGGDHDEAALDVAGREPSSALTDGFWERGVIPHLAFRVERKELAEADFLPVLRALGPGPGDTPPEDVIAVLAPLTNTGRRRVDSILDRVEDNQQEEAPPNPTVAQSLDDLLVAAAHQHGSLSSGFVAKALGIQPREARQYLKWLVEEGRLKVVGRARGTRYLPPDVPDEGSAVEALAE